MLGYMLDRMGIRLKMEKSRSKLKVKKGHRGDHREGCQGSHADAFLLSFLRRRQLAFYDRIIMLWMCTELLCIRTLLL